MATAAAPHFQLTATASIIWRGQAVQRRTAADVSAALDMIAAHTGSPVLVTTPVSQEPTVWPTTADKTAAHDLVNITWTSITATDEARRVQRFSDFASFTTWASLACATTGYSYDLPLLEEPCHVGPTRPEPDGASLETTASHEADEATAQPEGSESAAAAPETVPESNPDPHPIETMLEEPEMSHHDPHLAQGDSIQDQQPGFLTQRAAVPSAFTSTPAPVEQPRSFWQRLFGPKGPTQAEIDEQQRQQQLLDQRREWIETIARGWPGSRTISCLNTKGGAGKTPTVVQLAATFARYSGAGVLAWDNNETDGNLSERTDPGRHRATAVDLSEHAEEFMTAQARSGDLAEYVHRQPHDKFDALWSQLDDGTKRIMTGEDVATMHTLLSRFYQLLIIDSGNNDLAANAVAAFERTDQLIVPVTQADDKASRGWRNLDRFTQRGGKLAELADNAIVIVSCSEPGAHELAQQVAEGFRSRVSSAYVIPYDPALIRGQILLGNTSEQTQDTWLQIAADIARRF